METLREFRFLGKLPADGTGPQVGPKATDFGNHAGADDHISAGDVLLPFNHLVPKVVAAEHQRHVCVHPTGTSPFTIEEDSTLRGVDTRVGKNGADALQVGGA